MSPALLPSIFFFIPLSFWDFLFPFMRWTAYKWQVYHPRKFLNLYFCRQRQTDRQMDRQSQRVTIIDLLGEKSGDQQRETSRGTERQRKTYGSWIHPSGLNSDWLHHRLHWHWYTDHHHRGTHGQTDRQTPYWPHLQTHSITHAHRQTERYKSTSINHRLEDILDMVV